MSKPKHTPGPWKASHATPHCIGPTYLEVNSDNGEFICNKATDKPTLSEYLDFTLIAVAPEMLEALKWVLHHITETHGIKGDELSPVINAIAKAEGRDSDTKCQAKIVID